MKMLLAALAAIASLSLPAIAGQDFSAKVGFECDSPAAVEKLYALIDVLPANVTGETIMRLVAIGRERGINCAFKPSWITETGIVGEFTRKSDGKTMLIVRYVDPIGAAVYSWRLKPEPEPSSAKDA